MYMIDMGATSYKNIRTLPNYSLCIDLKETSDKVSLMLIICTYIFKGVDEMSILYNMALLSSSFFM